MSLRLIETITNTKDGRMAKVYRDAQWDEYRVRFYLNGTLDAAKDYHTSDKSDAQGTARSYTWSPTQIDRW